eukprot:CAMPEP_0118883964 /NCGR_PEP_ID=MMETSP1163-20130328/22931_1 /TAXON_ID=124430 /ORGANISM="Phaeomonas parva, Strain CCMP2877" /LENGTH=76 /DNA_ID=CAMNT_0006821579 /DNA_START=212 /DNA_END=442 /DNA_ORIENTATION=-
MSAPEPVISALFSYFGICLAAVAVTFVGNCLGLVKKDTASIAYVLYVIAFVCTYLLWLFAWLHQWHPLIKPEWKDE